MLTTTIAAGLEKTIGGSCPKGRLGLQDWTLTTHATLKPSPATFPIFKKRPGRHLYFATSRRVILLIYTTFPIFKVAIGISR